MPYLYVYSPSDFVGGLPDEVSAAADGTPNFTLTLVPGATPTLIEVTDDDLIFDEIDGSQTLTNAVNIDGSSFAAGTTINTAYDLVNTSNGHKVTSFHFGGDGYQQGAVNGLVSTVPLTAGSSYTFNTERTSHNQNNQYDDYVACFTTGTLIETKRGLVPVQELAAGDLILTLDNGFQPIRKVLSRRLSRAELTVKENLRPIHISAGALGQNVPQRDLLVSPQHRFLVRSAIAKRMFGDSEVLIAAKKLVGLPGVFTGDASRAVEYFHLVLDQHEIIFAENAPAESFYCGPMALMALCPQAREEIVELFPGVFDQDHKVDTARTIPCIKKQSQLTARHKKNCKPIIGSDFCA